MRKELDLFKIPTSLTLKICSASSLNQADGAFPWLIGAKDHISSWGPTITEELCSPAGGGGGGGVEVYVCVHVGVTYPLCNTISTIF